MDIYSMDDIRKWFNGSKDYAAGVKLYLSYGKDASLARLFTAEGYSEFKNKTLISALDGILSSGKKPLLATPVITKSPTLPAIPKETAETPPRPEKKWSKNPDQVEQALYLQWKPIFAEMMNLIARVGDVARAGKNDLAKEEEAGRMALRILDLDEECDAIYYNRDYYKKNSVLPKQEQPIKICLDFLLWPKKLQNHKRYVREFKAKVLKDPSDLKHAQNLRKHEWAVLEYERLLKIHDAVPPSQ